MIASIVELLFVSHNNITFNRMNVVYHSCITKRFQNSRDKNAHAQNLS